MPDGPRWDSAYHAPVLATEILGLLGERIGNAAGHRPLVVDGTLGGGGHALAFLEAGWDVVGLDRDPEAIAAAATRLKPWVDAGRFRAVQTNYAGVDAVQPLVSLRADAVLLDLGISSHQVDELGRGFSFREGSPLDMRMGPDAPADAASVLNHWEESALTRLFHDYGDEPRARRLAREVVRRRETRPFATSDDLVGAIRGAFGPRTGPGRFRAPLPGRSHRRERRARRRRRAPAGAAKATAAGRPAGRDRLPLWRGPAGEARLPGVEHRVHLSPRQPICVCGHVPLGRLVTRRAVEASAEEVARNPRARSAKLRVWERAEETAP
jgi:16S rRNA (cytosine1402-N4)-methyltransferase